MHLNYVSEGRLTPLASPSARGSSGIWEKRGHAQLSVSVLAVWP